MKNQIKTEVEAIIVKIDQQGFSRHHHIEIIYNERINKTKIIEKHTKTLSTVYASLI